MFSSLIKAAAGAAGEKTQMKRRRASERYGRDKEGGRKGWISNFLSRCDAGGNDEELLRSTLLRQLA